MNDTDRLYQTNKASRGSFKFDARVAAVFEDMISRSVPGYTQILELLPTLTRQFRVADKNYYDLGCSLGAGLMAIAQGLDRTPARLIGVDNSSAMIKRAKLNLTGTVEQDFILLEEDILTTKIEHAALVLMNFTLQFIPLGKRADLIQTIYDGLQTGGALIMSEKISFDDEKTNAALSDIHHQFKADQGYSDLEIAQKRDAIENVLIPETLAVHTQRLIDAGFCVVTPWVQNLQFVSILAIKSHR